jgi:hypothetical protein
MQRVQHRQHHSDEDQLKLLLIGETRFKPSNARINPGDFMSIRLAFFISTVGFTYTV